MLFFFFLKVLYLWRCPKITCILTSSLLVSNDKWQVAGDWGQPHLLCYSWAARGTGCKDKMCLCTSLGWDSVGLKTCVPWVIGHAMQSYPLKPHSGLSSLVGVLSLS